MDTGSVLPLASVAANDSSVVVTPGIAAAMADCRLPIPADTVADADRICAFERPVTATTTFVAAPLGVTLVMATWAADTLNTDAKEF